MTEFTLAFVAITAASVLSVLSIVCFAFFCKGKLEEEEQKFVFKSKEHRERKHKVNSCEL